MLNKTTCTLSIDEEILLVQAKRNEALLALKQELYNSIHQFNSNTFIEKFLDKIWNNADFKNDSIAIAAGFITEELIVGKSNSVTKQFVGNAVKDLVTAITAKYFTPF